MYTSYYANIKKLSKELKPISISRTCPKGCMIKMYGKLAPSPELLFKYKQNAVTWDEYKEIYYAETLSKLNPMQVYKDLGDNAVLICYEKPGDNCHRHIVAEWLRNAGIDIEEFGG